MRVIVTGSDGYIGARLVPYLTARGHDVVPVDAGFYADGWLPLDGVVPPPTIRKDVRDLDDRDLRDADAIVHLGELSNDPLGQFDPALTYEVNYHGSATLARRAKRLGIPRFVYSSSCSVYGAADDDARTETSAVAPQTAYAECKILVERALGALADDRFSPTILRNATAFGPSPRMRFDIVLNNLAGLAWTTREIRMVSDGSPWRPLVHVLDICHAFACALEAPRNRVHNEAFNVGDDRQNYRVRDIAEIVGATFPGCAVTFGSLNGDRRSYQVSFEKIHARLPGFRCARDAATGAAELHAWFETLSLDRAGFEFRAFTRLKQLEHLRATGRIDERLRWREALPVAA
ncbi:MAG: SDR family oxidoreductase [Candidatus Rokubacteria bacterium]|nr:SDR family oxidoreductase [Candidatus Rokubacteria bacterium]